MARLEASAIETALDAWRANCQGRVSLTPARAEVPAPAGLRLFLRDERAKNPVRCARAGVPEEHRRALAKTEIALEAIAWLVAAARFDRVLADAGYGMGAAFRQGLSARGLAWTVGVLKTQNVGAPTVALHRPAAATGRRNSTTSWDTNEASGLGPEASWTGLHHHARMTLIAFLQHLRLAQADGRRGKAGEPAFARVGRGSARRQLLWKFGLGFTPVPRQP